CTARIAAASPGCSSRRIGAGLILAMLRRRELGVSASRAYDEREADERPDAGRRVAGGIDPVEHQPDACTQIDDGVERRVERDGGLGVKAPRLGTAERYPVEC